MVISPFLNVSAFAASVAACGSPETAAKQAGPARVAIAGLEFPRQSASVTIGASGLTVNPGPLRDAPALKELSFKVAVPFAAPSASDGSLLIKPLFERASSLRDVSRSTAASDGTDHAFGVTVRAAPDTTYALLARVIYSLAQAEVSDIVLAVTVEGRPYVVPAELPKLRAASAHGSVHMVEQCAQIIAEVATRGILVRAMGTPMGLVHVADITSKKTALSGLLLDPLGGEPPLPAGLGIDSIGGGLDSSQATEPSDEVADWQDNLIVAEKGACPSVGTVDGALDLAALSDVVRRVQALAPGCKGVLVTVRPPVLFRILEPVLVRLRREGYRVSLGACRA
ncbi:MAG: hypothetical protein ACI9MR_004725 [Myxococcota bacterium]|jgi:hypothetical protein